MEGYQLFITKVYKKTGIDLSSYKERQMKRRIESLITRNNFPTYDLYYNAINQDKKLLDEFINYLTINVSEFYRNPQQWEILNSEIIPNLLKTRKKLKIWSSACSTGEECYSLVMALSKFYPLKDIEVLATDIDEGAITKAQLGVYTPKSVENLPNEFIERFFTLQSERFMISGDIKNRVRFKKLNLIEDAYPSDCDLILCRNVMIYFTEETKSKMYQKFHDALGSDGILFVGSTEQIILPHRYNLSPLKTFFYQKSNR
ncbi:Protein-glutamate O-methyltransferase [Alkaliphilus metalliredigens QYMF]|uniref:protein-glutamate O-methyltransferase n=1 Tax=Alkaliphilus metalliredigens (strain QYMF) TaxID=293826 RepID=A6TRF7_ALKMQ|nr:protein-glutamate O-methyltransferase CheR [Alkaliphilus metalliredigens]ABR48775.1 Protein-glutamate O-methyltransferase [Alkaliphilus metalliredigens QYMF]